MQADHPKERILANLSKPPGSFWTTSKLGARLLIGRQAEPTREQYERFAELMFEGDPLADAVAEWMLAGSVGSGMRAFDRALQKGIESVEDAPPALRALFAEVDQKPLWLDEGMLLAGQRAVQRTGVLMPYILGDVTLVGGYLTMASMNKSLVATGALERGSSAKRLNETLSWWLDVTGDHGLDREGPGFASTLKVRVMHALVRARLGRDPGWRFDEWGMPLSQAHLATTNQAFGVAFVTLARGFGVRYSAYEREAIMHLWRYCGFLMGVREAYCCATEREGFRLIALSVGTSPPPDADAAKLAEGYFEAAFDFGAVLPESARMQKLARKLSQLATRSRVGTLHTVIGASDARALNLPPPGGASMAFPILLGAATVATQSVGRLIPGSRALEARMGRRIHLGIKKLSPRNGPPTYRPYEHREGEERRAPRTFA